MQHNSKRSKQLEEQIQQARELLGELETTNLYTHDPLEKAKLSREITSIKSALDGWETELGEENSRLVGSSITELEEAVAPRKKSPQNTDSNPFRVAGRLENPTDFIGRFLAQDTLIDRSRKSLSTSLVGDRRIGKTWLMDYLQLMAPSELGSGYRVAYVDASLDSSKTVAGFVYSCLQNLKLSSQGSQATSLGLNTLENAVRYLLSKGQTAILCIDEFERFAQVNQEEFDINFFEGLRAIAGMGVALVTSSKKPLLNIVSQLGSTSPFFNIFEIVRVKPFSEKEAQMFSTEKGRAAGFDEFEQAKLREYGENFPLRLQLVGDMLYRAKRLAQAKDPDLYRPDDPKYWIEFKEHLEEKYLGMIQI